LPIVENEDGRTVLLYGSEFHEGMIISRGVETDGDLFGLVFVDEKEESFGIEYRIDGFGVEVAGVKF